MCWFDFVVNRTRLHDFAESVDFVSPKPYLSANRRFRKPAARRPARSACHELGCVLYSTVLFTMCGIGIGEDVSARQSRFLH